MKPVTMWLCRQVMRLDAIPRYGRLYPWNGPGGVKDRMNAMNEGRSIPKRAVQWRYMRRGRWGMNLLDKMGLFWPYLAATQQREPTDPDIPIR